MNIAIIGVGSNINASENIRQMLEILKLKTEVLAVSKMIQTKPIGFADQSEYTNGAVKVRTKLDINSLVILLKSIEDQLGRDRTVHPYGPRTMDLDIVMWNGEIKDSDYYTRDFVRTSVDEIRD